MTNLALLQALLFEPRKGFAELDARPRFWAPLLLLSLLQAALSYGYVSFVDLEWLVDLQLRSTSLGANLTEAELARMAQQAAGQVGFRAGLAAVSAALVIPLMLLVGGVFLWLATKVTGVERSFRHWFALSTWCTLPVTLIGMALAAVVLFTATTNQVPQAALQPLSLNEILLHRESDQPGYSLFSSMNLLQLLSIYLTAMGLKVWTNRSWTYCIIVAALPFALVFGPWAFFALR
jgi:hypothetical protein